MYDVYSQEFKYHYNRSKLKVKQWEERFKSQNGRIPTKADIKLSDAKVRYYYKIYWKLKTKLLEETILGGQGSTENNVSQCKSESVLKEHTNIIDDKCSGILKPKNGTPGKNMKENEDVNDVMIDPKTWGTHLNKVKPAPLQTQNGDMMPWNVCDKLFKGSKFKKRNPLKALKVAKCKIPNTSETNSLGSHSQTKIECTNTIISNESSISVDSLQTDFSPCPDAQDELSVQEKFSVQNDCSPRIKALIMSENELSPLFTKSYRVVSEPKSVHYQPVSLVDHLASNRKSDIQPSRQLDIGWLERCNESKIDHKFSTDSGFESTESSIVNSSSETTEKAVISEEEKYDDDDDIIADSDNEMNDSGILSIQSLKRKTDSFLNMSNEAKSSSTTVPYETPEKAAEQPSKRLKLDTHQLSSSSTKSTYEARLEKKIKSGTLNDNFVRINLKKKVYVRGKKNFSFTKHKKQQWKNLKKSLEGDEHMGIIRCYKCGDAGHYARYCQKTMEKLLPDNFELEDEDEVTLPTLEEAENMAKEKANVKKQRVLVPIMPDIEAEMEEPREEVQPLYALRDDRNLIETPKEVFDCLEKFGHSCFRPGQEQAIMRILSGLSTLVTITTGGGKSLCYQLPAYLYAMRSKCITLVVSPLVSLMEDQVSGSTSFFKLGCLHTNQTKKQRDTMIDDAKNGKLYALLVSPEAIVGGDNSSGLCNILKTLPPIAFACIDEVHCVSQWSHNFRPSYLMLTKVLKEKLGVKTILGLTATATKTTISSITKELEIMDTNGVIKDIPLPENLCLSVSQDENKDRALIELLKGPRFRDANAILIYCTRRDECERLAVLIRTLHNDTAHITANNRKRLSWNAESYHAGMSSARRKQVQKAFMKGHVRIVVATIAFGMGINKQDIRGVIHYNMPKDFESYVQEVGRAGRDGMLAHCHLFLDKSGRDLNELRRHIYSNGVDRHVLRKLLQRVFVECKCKERKQPCRGHEVAFDCSDTIQALDIPEENIYTLLCYLELHPDRMIKVLTPGFINCKIQSYRGAKAIIAAAGKCAPLAIACAQNPELLKESNTTININTIDVANTISWDSGAVKNQLKKIEWSEAKDDRSIKSGIIVDFFGLGFRLLSRGDMSSQELDDALDFLIQRVENQEKRSIDQLDVIFSALRHVSMSYEKCLEDYVKEKSDELKSIIRKYFETEELGNKIPLLRLQAEDFDEEEVASDVRALICSYRDNNFNGRTVARIFHGIQSPNYPASIWYKCRHWRQHMDKDFNKICKIATKEILRFK